MTPEERAEIKELIKASWAAQSRARTDVEFGRSDEYYDARKAVAHAQDVWGYAHIDVIVLELERECDAQRG